MTWMVVGCDKLSSSRASRTYKDCSAHFAGFTGAATAGLVKSRKRLRRALLASEQRRWQVAWYSDYNRYYLPFWAQYRVSKARTL